MSDALDEPIVCPSCGERYKKVPSVISTHTHRDFDRGVVVIERYTSCISCDACIHLSETEEEL
jgi:predicted RNA-binding Zn-ribbon protein involved in translation (DUF1610 family)